MGRVAAIFALGIAGVLDVVTGGAVVSTATHLAAMYQPKRTGSDEVALGFAVTSLCSAIWTTVAAVRLIQGRPYGGAWSAGTAVTCVLLPVWLLESVAGGTG